MGRRQLKNLGDLRPAAAGVEVLVRPLKEEAPIGKGCQVAGGRQVAQASGGPQHSYEAEPGEESDGQQDPDEPKGGLHAVSCPLRGVLSK